MQVQVGQTCQREESPVYMYLYRRVSKSADHCQASFALHYTFLMSCTCLCLLPLKPEDPLKEMFAFLLTETHRPHTTPGTTTGSSAMPRTR